MLPVVGGGAALLVWPATGAAPCTKAFEAASNSRAPRTRADARCRRVVAKALDQVRAMAVPGVTTADVDQVVADVFRDTGPFLCSGRA